MSKIEVLIRRLLAACMRLGGDLWARGIDVLQRRFGVCIYLRKRHLAFLHAGPLTITIE